MRITIVSNQKETLRALLQRPQRFWQIVLTQTQHRRFSATPISPVKNVWETDTPGDTIMSSLMGRLLLVDRHDLGKVHDLLSDYERGGTYKNPVRIPYDDLSKEGAVFLIWDISDGITIKQI